MTAIDSMYLLLTTAAVFSLQAGFLLSITGVTRAHHAIALFLKTFATAGIGVIAFFAIGYGLAFGPSAHGVFGTPHFSLRLAFPESQLPRILFLLSVFLLVPVIPLGAMAGRIRFPIHLAYAAFAFLLIVPLSFKWVWGSAIDPLAAGWLQKWGFLDRSGAAVVHVVAGAMALAASLVAGPRLGKYGADRKPRAMPGHHLPLSGIGMFLLIGGWPFFLGGFEPSFSAAHSAQLALVAILAACGGFFGALIPAWFATRKFDAPFALNGILAGLVVVCACPESLGGWRPLLVGMGAGALVFGGILFIEMVARIDDPAGAISVHGIVGAFGALLPGILHPGAGLLRGGGFHQILIQAAGTAVLALFAFASMWAFLRLLKALFGIRARPVEELRGLDLSEHGMEAYSGFQIFDQH
ncbi:MAG: ammonium transporter [Spirochaetes bacterium]|nr:ammonium transporter [Spirochaetota bacterium]